MDTVLTIIFGIWVFMAMPAVFIFGMIGFWILGPWGAFFGVLIGLALSSSRATQESCDCSDEKTRNCL